MGEGASGRGGGGRGGYHGRPSPTDDDGPIRPGTLRRAVGLFRPYRPQLSVVIFLVLIIASLGIITPLLIREVIDDAIPNGDRALLGWLVGIMIAVTAVTGVFNMAEVWINVGVGVRRVAKGRVVAGSTTRGCDVADFALRFAPRFTLRFGLSGAPASVPGLRSR